MKYDGMIFRPPSEADSLILQVTVGCSYNHCTFCGAYQGKRFRIKSFDEIKEDVEELSRYNIRRVFLADGDALSIPQKELLQLLSYLKARAKGLERVGIYANAKDILRKDVQELRKLKDLSLGIIYLGVESGDREVLKRIKKNATVNQLVHAGRRVKESGLSLSEYVIIGLGGKRMWQDHAVETAKVLNRINPDFIRIRTLKVLKTMPLYQKIERGEFIALNDDEMMKVAFLRHRDHNREFLILCQANFGRISGNMTVGLQQEKLDNLGTGDVLRRIKFWKN